MIAKNLSDVQNRIATAAQRAHRNPAEVTLVGVSKRHPIEKLVAAYHAGLRHFGENRVEEIEAKIPQFLAQLPADDLPDVHMIGHLQSRKVPNVLPHVKMIHSVDSVKLAIRINRIAQRDDLPVLPILLECNVSGEASKAGFALSDWEKDAVIFEDFCDAVRAISVLEKIEIQGLMTMAPIVDEPERARPYFVSLRKLKAKCAKSLPEISWQHLSMGMTDDFEVAVEEGATLVRVGRAIFGEREY